MVGVYEVTTLCGSTRFKDEFLEVQKELTLRGRIVLSVGVYGHQPGLKDMTSESKVMLDDMHKCKIDCSDGIFVINPHGYIGASTKSEIEYAREHGKKIEYLENI